MIEEEMSKKEVEELALSKILLITLVVLGLLAVFWFGWVRPARQYKAINSFATCAVSNPVQESYPQACMTKDGRRFVKTK